jgi:ATP-dependent Clp protease ATP-binding subunit ClpA
VPFAPLPQPVIHKVVQKFVLQLEAQLAERDVTFDLSPEAVEWLASRGYDERMGARPLARVIQEHIKKPLADRILFGDLKNGGIVRVMVDEGGDKLLLASLPPNAPMKPKREEPEEEVAAAAPKKRKAAVAKTAKAAPRKAEPAKQLAPVTPTVPRLPRKG